MVSSEKEIFRATSGLAMNASLARTLAYCLYWSQHATHWEGEFPTIWKTGPELQATLRIASRTANRHFKDLAKLSYWTLSYRPRPGSIGKVTWLTMTERAVQLLEVARQLAATRTKKKKHFTTLEGVKHDQLDVQQHDIPSYHDVTSKQTHGTEITTQKNKKFFLSSEAGKQGMNESFQEKKIPGKSFKAQPHSPKYVAASAADKAIASTIRSAWSAAGLQEWDWSSKFTWQFVAEIRGKLAKVGVSGDEPVKAFLVAMLNKWIWLRSCLAPRYASHVTNLHAPSPMAFSIEFGVIAKAVLEKKVEQQPKQTKSNLDEDL